MLLILIVLAGCGNESVEEEFIFRERFLFQDLMPKGDSWTEIHPRCLDLWLSAEESVEEPVPSLEWPYKTAEGRYAYLTFDDGPSRNSHGILDILADYGIPATFFVLGEAVNGRSDSGEILNRILEEGHYIGLHSMSHDFSRLYLEPDAHYNFYEEMRQVQELVYQLTGHLSYHCRAPFGTVPSFSQKHQELIQESDFNCWDWHVDTRDWAFQTSAQVMGAIQENMAFHGYPSRVVVLMHELDLTIAALPEVIHYFLDLGYTFLPFHPKNYFPVRLNDH